MLLAIAGIRGQLPANMADIEPDAFVNRDEPIPILKIDGEDANDGKQKSRHRHSPSPTRFKRTPESSSSSLQDRFFSA